jgi:hypothetical protein
MLELERYFTQPPIDAWGRKYVSEQALGATMTLQETINLAQSLVERDL